MSAISATCFPVLTFYCTHHFYQKHDIQPCCLNNSPHPFRMSVCISYCHAPEPTQHLLTIYICWMGRDRLSNNSKQYPLKLRKPWCTGTRRWAALPSYAWNVFPFLNSENSCSRIFFWIKFLGYKVALFDLYVIFVSPKASKSKASTENRTTYFWSSKAGSWKYINSQECGQWWPKGVMLTNMKVLKYEIYLLIFCNAGEQTQALCIWNRHINTKLQPLSMKLNTQSLDIGQILRQSSNFLCFPPRTPPNIMPLWRTGR